MAGAVANLWCCRAEVSNTTTHCAQRCCLRLFVCSTLCRAQQKVAEQRGADQAGLRRLIQQQLPLLSRPAGGGGVKSPLVAALLAALGRVKQGCSYAEFVTAVKTLLAFVGNCLANPSDQKYRRIKLSNPAYQSRLGCRAGGKECLAAIGFRWAGQAARQWTTLLGV